MYYNVFHTRALISLASSSSFLNFIYEYYTCLLHQFQNRVKCEHSRAACQLLPIFTCISASMVYPNLWSVKTRGVDQFHLYISLRHCSVKPYPILWGIFLQRQPQHVTDHCCFSSVMTSSHHQFNFFPSCSAIPSLECVTDYLGSGEIEVYWIVFHIRYNMHSVQTWSKGKSRGDHVNRI